MDSKAKRCCLRYNYRERMKVRRQLVAEMEQEELQDNQLEVPTRASSQNQNTRYRINHGTREVDDEDRGYEYENDSGEDAR